MKEGLTHGTKVWYDEGEDKYYMTSSFGFMIFESSKK